MIDKFSDEDLKQALRTLLNKYDNVKALNSFLENKTGIIDFFKSTEELKECKQFLDKFHTFNITDRDLGDFQTSYRLTDKICKYLVDAGFAPGAIVEPTCGKGNFVLSAIKFFPPPEYIYCVEVQSKYEWLFKLNILRLSFNQNINAKIEFHHDNIFTHQFSDRFMKFLNDSAQSLLILGNPPWITSNELSTLNSNNLPCKANIKNYRGIEAITGKSNFDIAESIILQMIRQFSDRKGKVAMLCKTSVIRNIVKDVHKLNLKISNVQELLIDAQKEFGISADAALFLVDINSQGETLCTVAPLDKPHAQFKKYGWVHGKFASDVKLYEKYAHLDGRSRLEWRQGVKHDASRIMVLKNLNGSLLNGFRECVEVEEDVLYPFIKGSELKKRVIKSAALKIIITQTSPSEDTTYIKLKYPRLWNYLSSHSKYLDERKSKIYKSRFSIFGIGEYSFKRYKVAIPALYKEPTFSLILPVNNRPVMLDDTCYYLSFDSFDNAFFTWVLLNTEEVKCFLSSIAFLDSKRPYTKEVLMRIDLLKVAESISLDEIFNVYQRKVGDSVECELTEANFLKFKDSLKKESLCLNLY